MLIRNSIAFVLASLTSALASAAISVTGGGFTYAQNFNGLVSASSSPVPAAWANDSTIAGWSLFTSTLAAPATYRAEIGNQDIGSFTSYGSSNAADRA